MPNDAGESYPRFLPVGDMAVTVEFGNAIDAGLNAQVMALDVAIAAGEVPGVTETMPAYRSLLVCYEPDETSLPALIARLRALLGRPDRRRTRRFRTWTVPVAYGGAYGDDLAEAAAVLTLTPEQVVAAHSGAEYLVYLVGFNPGAPNLGGLPQTLHIPRRKVPRPSVPASSVAIGGMQSGITSIATPTGWYVLGRTPVRPYMADRAEPFLFQPGDRIRFSPISADAFPALDAAAARREPVAVLHTGPTAGP